MRTEVRDFKAGSLVAGYTIEGVCGRGGMGIVYRARQEWPRRRVALKVVSPELASDAEFRARFEREVDIAASIEHPNVIPIYSGGKHDDVLYLAMRFIDGTDLRAWLISNGPMPPLRVAGIAAQLGDALDAAHAAGLVHRDVKPGNVLLTERNGRDHVYLTDFGLTKQASSTGGLTKTGTWVGTVDYVAPEQIRGERVDAHSDVYSLGCVLFHLLSGQVPFDRESDVSKIFAHISDPPPSLADVGTGALARFDEVIRRAMAKDPAERYPSAGDLGRATVAAAEGRPVEVEERPVGAGDAAPSVTRLAGAGETEPQRTEVDEGETGETEVAATELETPRGGGGRDTPETVRRRRFRRWPIAVVAAVAALGATAGALAAAGVFSSPKTHVVTIPQPNPSPTPNPQPNPTPNPQPSAAQQAGQAALGAMNNYWKDIKNGDYSSAYNFLEPGVVAQDRSTFVAEHQAEGIESVSFQGSVGSSSANSATIDVVSLTTNDQQSGCRNWTGDYKLDDNSGSWLINTVSIQPHTC